MPDEFAPNVLPRGIVCCGLSLHRLVIEERSVGLALGISFSLKRRVLISMQS